MSEDIGLIAHLMRRAGFGASRGELEAYAARGYEATVEWLLNPGDPGEFGEDLAKRRAVGFDEGGAAFELWVIRMIHSNNPLEEKMALFLHGLFPVMYMSQGRALLNQLDSFRRHAFGSFRDLLIALSSDPAMLLFLNNNDNHMEAMNENYGRELIELFSMGVGNYTEKDVKECARAFTGWTLGNADYMAVRAGKNSFDPYGSIAWHFEYRPEDHDTGVKTFLGETGEFNGEDICDIIARQPSSARFICTRLFQFFAADNVDDEGRRTIDEMVETYYSSGYETRSVLRTLFNSDYFKSEQARYARVKGPRRACYQRRQDDRRLAYAYRRVGRGERSHRLHGAGAVQAPKRGGLARGQGVDRERRTDGAGQLRREAIPRPEQARRARHHRPDRRQQWRRVFAGGDRRSVLGAHRAGQGLRGDAIPSWSSLPPRAAT